MGAGKSFIGRRLAREHDLRLLDLDQEIERRCGMSVTAIFEQEGETGFRAHERAVLAELLGGEDLLIATGGGAVLDAGNRALLRRRGFVVHLQVGVEQQLRRLAHDRTRPLLARPDREQVLQALAAARTPLYAEVADLQFDTGALQPEQAAAQLSQLLSLHWQRPGVAA